MNARAHRKKADCLPREPRKSKRLDAWRPLQAVACGGNVGERVDYETIANTKHVMHVQVQRRQQRRFGHAAKSATALAGTILVIRILRTTRTRRFVTASVTAISRRARSALVCLIAATLALGGRLRRRFCCCGRNICGICRFAVTAQFNSEASVRICKEIRRQTDQCNQTQPESRHYPFPLLACEENRHSHYTRDVAEQSLTRACSRNSYSLSRDFTSMGTEWVVTLQFPECTLRKEIFNECLPAVRFSCWPADHAPPTPSVPPK